MARNQQQELVFNTAIELNDIAISLIERGCYQLAMETLRIATLIMKNHCCLHPTQNLASNDNITLPIQNEYSNVGLLQCKLQDAAWKLWLPHQTLETNKSTNNRVWVVWVISEDEHPATVACFCADNGFMRSHAGEGGQEQVFILIRLCCMDEMNEILTTMTTEMAAKIIYNYCIATQCLAISMTMVLCHWQKLEVQAFSALKIAFTNTLNDQDGICSDINKFNRASVLMLLMLHHLIDLSHKLGDDLHFHDYSMCLHKLQRWISILCKMQSTTLGHASAT